MYSDEALAALTSFVAAEARLRRNRAGGLRGQWLHIGRVRKAIADALFESLREKAEELEAKKQRLQSGRRRKLSELDGMSVDGLRDQIRVFQLVDGVDIRIGQFMTKLSLLMALSDLFKEHLPHGACDCNAKKLAEMAGKKAKQASSGGKTSSRGKGKQQQPSEPEYGSEAYEVDMIVGARMGEKGRQYRVQWMEEHPEFPDEPWQTWVYFGAIFTGDAVSTELEKQIEEIDKITPGECILSLLSSCHACVQSDPCLLILILEPCFSDAFLTRMACCSLTTNALADEEVMLEEGDAAYHELFRCAEEGRLRKGDRVLHDTGKPTDEGGDGIRPGTVVGVQDDSRLKVKYDVVKLDRRTLPAKEVVIDKTDKLSKAPPETTLKAGDFVRVAQDGKHIDGQKWCYGVVRWVHSKLLLDINFDDGDEPRGLPAYAHEVQKAR